MRIRDACSRTFLNYNLQPDKNEGYLRTWCNIAVKEISDYFGYNFPPTVRLANEIYDFMLSPKSAGIFEEVSPDKALAMAYADKLVIACEKGAKRGHVAVVYPLDMQYSGKHKKNVPMVYSVGRQVGIMTVGYAFRGEPKYYLLIK